MSVSKTKPLVRRGSFGIIFGLTLAVAFAHGCNSPNLTAPSTAVTPTPTPTSTIPNFLIQTGGGPRAARIIFTLSASGSFDSSNLPGNGTPNVPGQGMQISRVFNPDGSLLASQTFSSGTAIQNSSWPLWLKSFEIGLSGQDNTAAKNPSCATFAGTQEALLANCNLGQSSTSNCGAPANAYRVSEVDCAAPSTGPPTSAGNGGPSDGIYFRAVFNRNGNFLGQTENILVVIEYSASSLNPATARPQDCYVTSSGTFAPENCSDFTWKAFLKNNPTDGPVQPFLLLIPPTVSSVLSGGVPTQSGTNLTTRQFILPLAAYPISTSPIMTLQISRINSSFSSLTNLTSICSVGGLGNSPLCAGLIVNAITFYRM